MARYQAEFGEDPLYTMGFCVPAMCTGAAHFPDVLRAYLGDFAAPAPATQRPCLDTIKGGSLSTADASNSTAGNILCQAGEVPRTV